MISLVLIAVIVLTNLVALGQLVHDLVSAQVKEGGPLLLAALQVWATNVIAFALIYWELDRGGPVARVNESAQTSCRCPICVSHTTRTETR